MSGRIFEEKIVEVKLMKRLLCIKKLMRRTDVKWFNEPRMEHGTNTDRIFNPCFIGVKSVVENIRPDQIQSCHFASCAQYVSSKANCH